jgi:hypothetical protein
LLNRRQHQHTSRGDDRERITSARQAAEALFTPKRQLVEPSDSNAPPSGEQFPRKPRLLTILSSPQAGNKDVAAPINPEPQTTREIPRSQFVRIRTWIKYGMTTSQVAKIYGVTVGEIERIRRQT